MAKQSSPLQRVKSQHTNKAKLADKVLGFLSAPEGEDQDFFEARIKTMSNAKLLRIFDAHQRVEKEFGSKQALVDKIVSAKFAGGNAPYATKIGGYTEARLLDLARQSGVKGE